MDYLPLPQHLVLPPIEVSFYDPIAYWYDADWQEYIDGRYWDNFPKRYGYELDDFWEDLGSYSNKAWAHGDFHTWLMQKPSEELEAMAVAWLFFGTLAEVTCCHLDIANYLKVADNGRFVLSMTKASMNAILDRWFIIQTHFRGSVCVRGVPEPQPSVMMDRAARLADKDGIQTQYDTPLPQDDLPRAKLNAQGRSLPFERAHKCLQKSKAIIGLMCEAIEPKTVFVIANLHEFLAHALTNLIFRGEVEAAYDMLGGYSLGMWTGGSDFTHYTRGLLRSLGWCPRTTAS
ncbi:uncharacterized protein Z518_08075 [Rhinocladiella mackenziei CBS 650.93]|uniref:Uncharacterized protein n=1 Tax=Rhinocladiella mackenziei CBS 650.93 TaxID=1442369 RepID=A0A0D2IFU1_9EURO|nr:uncharacterized protein Z518_08075 [Rhinocladiella mackenziei CBS 650.93]KIX02136.1 hypothetical protein Z518_08075 [Rhinocladiella mackenziei CBS 650.93]